MIATVIFVLTVIFVAYIVYSVVEEDKTKKVVTQEQTKTDNPVITENSTTAQKTLVRPKALRHPESGESAAVPSTYRFAKRWIKEALVSEGLLDKVYKNKELDADNTEKVKAALAEFKTLEKYHAEK